MNNKISKRKTLFILWGLYVLMSIVVGFILKNYFISCKLVAFSVVILMSKEQHLDNEKEKSIFNFIVFIIIGLLSIQLIINGIAHFKIEGATRDYVVQLTLKLISIISIATSIYCLQNKTKELEKKFVIVALLTGLIYMFAMTPLSVPDETFHYQSSYMLSNAILCEDEINEINSEYNDYSKLKPHYVTKKAYDEISEGLFLSESDSDKKIEGKLYSLDYPIQYLPQVIGIIIGRLLKFRFLGVFYLGRLCNLLFYILCVYYCIKKAPQFKDVFFVCALFPMSIHQAASMSPDAFINGAAFLTIGTIINWYFNSVSKKEKIKLIIISVLLAPAKVVYIVLDALILLVPSDNMGGKKKKILYTIIVITLGIVFIILFKISAIQGLTTDHTSTANYSGEVFYSLSDFWKNPLSIAKVYYSTLENKWFWYFETMLGSSLAGLSLIIPKWLMFSVEVVFFLSVLPSKVQSFAFSIREKCLLLFIEGTIIILVMTSMLVGWTPLSSDTIEGVQGRYFIPILPLIMMTLRGKNIKCINDISKQVEISLCLVNMSVVLYVIETMF